MSTTPNHRKVQGRCPACGLDALFLADGGYVTCGSLECSDPCAATDRLEQPTQTPTEAGDGVMISLGRASAEWLVEEADRQFAAIDEEDAARLARIVRVALRSTRQDTGLAKEIYDAERRGVQKGLEGYEGASAREAAEAQRADHAHALLDRIEGMVEEWESSAATDGWSLASRIASVLGDRDVPSPPIDTGHYRSALEQLQGGPDTLTQDGLRIVLAALFPEPTDFVSPQLNYVETLALTFPDRVIEGQQFWSDAYDCADEKLKAAIAALSTEKPGGES